MTKIALVRLTDKKYYGGYAHENAILDALSEDFDVELINIEPKNRSVLKYSAVPIVLWKLFKFSRRSDFDIVIRNFESSLFLSKSPVKNVFLLFHIDKHHGPIHYKLFHLIFGKYILQRLKKVDASAVMSEHGRRFLEKNGFKNVCVAYYPSDPKKFKFTIEEIEDFKSRFNLTSKPIIYLGVARRDKGVEESFNALKNLDYHFVTSIDESFDGVVSFKVPVRVLRLKYRDYLRLLKASSVAVAMSKVLEGWCINVQDAMLCKTPVVGSGSGGMRELLEGGGQLVCEDFEELPKMVESAIMHQELGERGYKFAKTFTPERFKQDWSGIINSIKTN